MRSDQKGLPHQFGWPIGLGLGDDLLELPLAVLVLSMESTAETNCASWRRESVPVGLGEKDREALVDCRTARCEPGGTEYKSIFEIVFR
jgi:hypothetical protein